MTSGCFSEQQGGLTTGRRRRKSRELWTNGTLRLRERERERKRERERERERESNHNNVKPICDMIILHKNIKIHVT